MTFLPIVERELRVAARRKSTYALRFFAALLVIVVWLILLIGSNVAMPGQMGRHLYNALGILALGFSLLAGVFLTADCLSEEKRGGTLGLLFLTDLKGYDIVLGKLAAASLHAIFGLLAIFPILALPLMMGGVTGAEFARLALVLVSTLFLSLALGLFVSSLSQEARHSISLALWLVILLAGVFPALWWLQSILVNAPSLDPLLLPSPAYAYVKAFALSYSVRTGPAEFWRSVGTIVGLGLACVVGANLILPRVWQQGRHGFLPRLQAALPPLFRRGQKTNPPRPRRPVTGNPYFWLASRDGSAAGMAKVSLRLLIPIWLSFLFVSLFVSKFREAFISSLFIACGIHVVIKILIANQATRRITEDRQSGALELILITPLPVRVILQGHGAALRNLFRPTLMALYLVNLTMIATVLLFGKPLDMQRDDQAIFCELFLGGMLMLAMDFSTLSWVGMWTALNARRHHRAVIATVGKVMGVPWAMVFLMVFLRQGFGSAFGAAMAFGLWFGLGLTVDLIVRATAKNRLEREFRAAALQQFGPKLKV